MNTSARLALVFLLALIVQLTVFVDVRVAGVAPELLALVAILAAFFVGPERGPVIAFLAGLLWDVYLPTPLGVAAVSFALVAFAVGSFEEGLFDESRGQLLAIAGLASGGGVVTFALIGELVGQRGLLDVDMLKVALLVGFLNAALAPLAAPLLQWALNPANQRP